MKMKLRTSLTVLAPMALLLAWVGSVPTADASVHALSGNARFQIGDGLPIPITVAPPPVGGVVALPGAQVSQPLGLSPRKIKFLLGGELKATPAPVVLPVFTNNPAVFQVKTSLGISFPVAPATFSAGGRTGASTVSMCAGSIVPPAGNPGCFSAAAGPSSLKGRLIYTKTSAQFGGPMGSLVFGSADVALLGASPAPCVGCPIVMALASPSPLGGGGPGNAFGASATSPGSAPPSGILTGSVLANGLIVTATPTASLFPGVSNAATSVAGPWTTGMVTVSMTNALGSAEIFVFSGSDARVAGVGSISLVAAGLSNRQVSGPNANRGWLNLTVPEPSGIIGFVSSLGALFVLHGLTSRSRR